MKIASERCSQATFKETTLPAASIASSDLGFLLNAGKEKEKDYVDDPYLNFKTSTRKFKVGKVRNLSQDSSISSIGGDKSASMSKVKMVCTMNPSKSTSAMTTDDEEREDAPNQNTFAALARQIRDEGVKTQTGEIDT